MNPVHFTLDSPNWLILNKGVDKHIDVGLQQADALQPQNGPLRDKIEKQGGLS